MHVKRNRKWHFLHYQKMYFSKTISTTKYNIRSKALKTMILHTKHRGKVVLLTSEVEVLSVVIGAEVNMLYDVSFGPVSMLARPVLGGLQHSNTSVGKVGGECGIQRSFFCAA